MLELGVDEITLVLQIPDDDRDILEDHEWSDVAERMISRFEMRSDLINIFGERQRELKAPSGYTMAYKYGNHSFYFAIAYHNYMNSMGVIIKFSAQSLDYYLESTGIKVYEFLQKISCSDYSQRLSRIDLTADYIDEDIDISSIYQDLMDSRVAVFREQFNSRHGKMEYRRVPMQYNGILNEQDVQTIYVGSRKSNTILRIYDKKIEQILRKGNKYEKALRCDTWVRFEGVFRNEYAHQLSEELMKTSSDYEFANLIAVTLYQKYLFMNVDNGMASVPTEYTQMLMDCINNNKFKLKAPITRNYELSKNISYIFYGSGVMNTFHKIKEIWGMDAVRCVLNEIAKRIQDKYKPTDDCRYWLNHNAPDYKRNYPDFDSFVNDNLSLLIK